MGYENHNHRHTFAQTQKLKQAKYDLIVALALIVMTALSVTAGMFTTQYVYNTAIAKIFGLPVLTLVQTMLVSLGVHHLTNSRSVPEMIRADSAEGKTKEKRLEEQFQTLVYYGFVAGLVYLLS